MSNLIRKKVIFLIIDSDKPHTENYNHCREIWRRYMNIDPDIQCFFIRSEPNLQNEIFVDEGNNLIISKGEESHTPGIFDKTIKSMKYIIENYDFDFLIRTNLSSFYNFRNLKLYLEGLPKENCINAIIWKHCRWIGHRMFKIPFPSGCGFTVSKDMVKLLVEEHHIVNSSDDPDDVMISIFYQLKNKKLTHGKRKDFTSSYHFNAILEDINSSLSETYHYRVVYDRAEQDKFIREKLYEKIYN